MIVNKYSGNGGGGGYVLPTATDSRLGGVKIGSGISVDSGGTISATDSGKIVVNLDNTSQAERATLYTQLWAVSGTVNELYEFYCTFTGATADNNTPIQVQAQAFNTSDYGGSIFFCGASSLRSTTNKLITYRVILLADGSLADKGAKSTSLDLPKASSSTLGGVKVGSGLTIDNNGVLSVSGGTAGGPTVINLDALTQQELADLYEQLSGETSASTVNENYIFLKSFSQVHGGNKVPFAVQFMGYFSYKIRFSYCKVDNGHSGEIWLLTVDVKDNGDMEVSMAPNYTFPGLQRLQLLNSRDYIKYDFTTSTFSTNMEGDTMFTGDTCSGAWVFNTDRNQNAFIGAYVPEYVLRITDTDVENRKLMNPVVSYDTLSTPVMLTDSGGTERPFGYIFYFDYGKYTLSMYVDWDQQRYARLSIVKN